MSSRGGSANTCEINEGDERDETEEPGDKQDETEEPLPCTPVGGNSTDPEEGGWVVVHALNRISKHKNCQMLEGFPNTSRLSQPQD